MREHERNELPEDAIPRLLIGPDITLVVSAIGVDPEGVGWVRLAVQTPDDPKPNNGLGPDGNGSATKS